MQTRATRLHEQLSAMSIETKIPVDAPTAPLKDRLRMARETDVMEIDQKAALRAPFKDHISTRLCQESFW